LVAVAGKGDRVRDDRGHGPSIDDAAVGDHDRTRGVITLKDREAEARRQHDPGQAR
jgi:hypothetical protein